MSLNLKSRLRSHDDLRAHGLTASIAKLCEALYISAHCMFRGSRAHRSGTVATHMHPSTTRILAVIALILLELYIFFSHDLTVYIHIYIYIYIAFFFILFYSTSCYPFLTLPCRDPHGTPHASSRPWPHGACAAAPPRKLRGPRQHIFVYMRGFRKGGSRPLLTSLSLSRFWKRRPKSRLS